MGRDIVRQNPTELSLAQLAAVAALVRGSSVTEAASKAEVDRTTVHRWLAEDCLFVATVNRAKQDAIDAIRAEVQAGAVEAVKVIREILGNPESGPAVRLRAALSLLESVGATVPKAIGLTDPEDVAAKHRRRDTNRMLNRITS